MTEHRRRAYDHLLPTTSPSSPLHDLIAQAVGDALDKRWRSMVATTAVIGVVAALIVALPFTLIQNASTTDAAKKNAEYNCRVLVDVAQIMGAGNPKDRVLKHGGFLSTDAALRQREATNTAHIRGVGPLARLLADPDTLKLEQTNAKLDRTTTAYWRTVLIPRLLSIAKPLSCSHLPGS